MAIAMRLTVAGLWRLAPTVCNWM